MNASAHFIIGPLVIYLSAAATRTNVKRPSIRALVRKNTENRVAVAGAT